MTSRSRYVVQCFKRVRRTDVLLGSRGYYEFGDYVTYDGKPSGHMDDAAIYGGDGEMEFAFDEVLGNGIVLGDHFRAVPVTLRVKH